MNKPPGHIKVFLLGASFNTRNMGVGALTAGTIKSVKYCWPQADIFLMDYGKRGEFYNVRALGTDMLVELVNIRFSKKIFLKNNIALLILLASIARLLPFKVLRERIISSNPCLKRLDGADVVASIAGGDSFSDIYGLGRFFYVSLPQLLALIMGKRLVLLPQTLGPFRNRITKAVARFIIGNSSVVYSRDYPGLLEARELLGNGYNADIRFSYDMGFILDPVAPERASEAAVNKSTEMTCRVGLNVSGLLYMGGYTKNNMFGLKVDYKDLVREMIDFIINKKGAEVMLIPHVFGAGDNPESDSEACKTVYNELNHIYGDKLTVVKGRYDQGGIKHIIGSCDFFIGSRMHACIAALSQSVPAVPVAYSGKFLGVMESIGVQSHVADPCRLSVPEIMGVINNAFEKRAEIRKQLDAVMPGVREKALNLFKELPA